jgi:hypothetical protein
MKVLNMAKVLVTITHLQGNNNTLYFRSKMKNLKNSKRVHQNIVNIDTDSPKRPLKIMQGNRLSYATGTLNN